MKPWILGLALAVLGASCNTADLMLSIKGSVADAGTPLPLPAIVPAGGTYYQSSDITGINVGSSSSGYRLFYTSDGTTPAFTPGGTPDWAHTGRSDTGMMSWGSMGPWPAAIGVFTVKAQSLDSSGRRSGVASADFRVVGDLGAVSVATDSASAKALALSAADDVATATSGPTAVITVRNPNNQVLWTRTISGTGTVIIKDMAYSTSGRLWVCGNVQSGGTFSVSGGPVTFTPFSSQAGFLVSFDSAGNCLGAVYEAAPLVSAIQSSFNGLALNDANSFVYLAASIDRLGVSANFKLQYVTAAGALGILGSGPPPVNAGRNAAGLRLDYSGNLLGTVANNLNNSGATDSFECVTYNPTGGIVAFGGWAQGPQFEYDGTTPVTAMGTSNRAPVVVATDYIFSPRYTLIGTRSVVATANAQVEKIAELTNGHVVAAGTEGPADGVGWSWPNGGPGLVITPTDTSTAFWVSMSSGAAFAVQQISSPSSISLGGLTTVDSSAAVITSYTVGAGTSSGWVGLLAPAGTPSPWAILTTEALTTPGWWRYGGLGPGTAGPLVHAAGALNRVATLWYPSGAPAMDLGQGLTAPSTSGALLIRLFD